MGLLLFGLALGAIALFASGGGTPPALPRAPITPRTKAQWEEAFCRVVALHTEPTLPRPMQVIVGAWRLHYGEVPSGTLESQPADVQAEWLRMLAAYEAWIADGPFCAPPAPADPTSPPDPTVVVFDPDVPTGPVPPVGPPLPTGPLPPVGPPLPTRPVPPVGPPLPTGPLPPVPTGPTPPPFEPVPPGPTPTPPGLTPEVFQTYVTDTPEAGAFYQVKQGDNLSALMRQMLGVGSGSSLVAPAVRCLAASKYNARLYGRGAEQGTFDAVTQVEEGGATTTWNIRPAFLPRNANAFLSWMQLQAPTRNITWSGARVNPSHSSYGLIWIPEMRVIGGQLVCPGGPDDDSMNPPRELLAAVGVDDVRVL